jgi:hypothetical protein
LLQASRSLYALWPDGTCKQLGLQDKVNASIVAVLQAMVNASNSPAVASLLNSKIGSLGSAGGGSAAAAMVGKNCVLLSMRMNAADKVSKLAVSTHHAHPHGGERHGPATL